MGKEETNKSEIVKHYLKSMFLNLINHDKNQAKRIIIVWDNAPVHTSNATIEFIRSAKLRVLTIPPYSPSLNPAEKLINAIKMKLKKFQANGGLVSLRAIKQAFDSAAQVDPSKYVKASRKELEKLLKQAYK